MTVPVVYVRIVRVTMRQPFVAVRMRMVMSSCGAGLVRVLVMFVMLVFVTVLDRLVRMPVLMPFRGMQPDARSHQRRRDPEEQGRLLV